MGIKVNKSEVLALVSANNGLADNENSLRKAIATLSGFVFEESLKGQTWAAAKNVASNAYIPLLKGLIAYSEQLQDGLTKVRIAADGFDYMVLDEDVLHYLKNAAVAYKKALQWQIDELKKLRSVSEILYQLTAAPTVLVLEGEMFMVDAAIAEFDKQIKALHVFANGVSGVFDAAIKTRVQLSAAFKALGNNGSNVYQNGEFMISDKPLWAQALEDDYIKAYEKHQQDYEQALAYLVPMDADGRMDINDYNKQAIYQRVKDWLQLWHDGKLTPAQEDALKTFFLASLGGYENGTGLTDWFSQKELKLYELPFINQFCKNVLGFQYNNLGQYYYTSQDSMQSFGGYMDFYDDLGPVLGMDLDTQKVQFDYDGKQYNFQLWKGTYGAGTAVGAEQGLYVFDPSDPVLYMEKGFFAGLGDVFGMAIGEPGAGDNWAPKPNASEQIRMVNEIYNKTTGKRISTNDTNGKAYWNADLKAVDGSGYNKDGVYTVGTLYIDDAGLRDEMAAQLSSTEGVSDVKIQGNEVKYTWGK